MAIEISDEAKTLIEEQEPVAPKTQEVFEKLHNETAGQGATTLALLKAPKGMKFVYNRLPQRFEKFFDGAPYVWEANEELPLRDEIAEFMYRTSVVSYEPVTGEAVRALVTTDDPKYGVPYVADLGPELLSREISDNYIQRGTGGLNTHAKVIAVRGGGYDNGKPASGRSRILGS